MVQHIGDVLRLVWRAGFNHAAPGLDIDRFTVLRHVLCRLFQHADFFNREVNVFRIDILNFATHGRGINIKIT